MIGYSNRLANQLMAILNANADTSFPFDKGGPIMLTSFVNLDKLDQSSSLGRLMAEQVGARFTQRGYLVIDPRLDADNIHIVPRSGELALSRKLQNLSKQHHVQAILVGNYSVAQESTQDKLFVNLKLIRVRDNLVISSLSSSTYLKDPEDTLIENNWGRTIAVKERS